MITLRRGSSYMTKLSLSHALAQSTKISFFEGIIDNTIDTTKVRPLRIHALRPTSALNGVNV